MLSIIGLVLAAIPIYLAEVIRWRAHCWVRVCLPNSFVSRSRLSTCNLSDGSLVRPNYPLSTR